jgi:hypothetical protein
MKIETKHKITKILIDILFVVRADILPKFAIFRDVSLKLKLM